MAQLLQFYVCWFVCLIVLIFVVFFFVVVCVFQPSMEIFGYSDKLNKWIEVGNSGIFRPEMLKPMGLPDDVRVIAWGLSLER